VASVSLAGVIIMDNEITNVLKNLFNTSRENFLGGGPVKMSGKVSDIPVAFITAAAFVIIVAGIQAAAPIIIPFLLAAFIATLCAPLLFWVQRRGVSNSLAILIIFFGLLVVALLLLIFAGRSLNSLSRQLPTYQERLGVLITQVFVWLNSQGIDVDVNSFLLTDYFSPRAIMNLVSYGLSILRVLFTNIFLILLTVLFILLETSSFPRKLQTAFPDPEILVHFKTISANVNRYMGYKALISLATGVSIWTLLAIIGVDFAGTWGLLAFFLNFIPAIGSIIAAIPAILWALVQLGLPSALFTALAYLAVNIIIGNFLDPRILGRKLGLSPLVVFISLIFWGWVLGAIGMVLSVPLTMIAKIALATNEDTRWIAIMLE
jgi:AI-2 transport protein TqsA